MQVIVGNPRSATAARPYGEPWTAITDVKKLEANSSVDRWTGGVTVNFTPFQRFTHRLTLGLDQVSDEINKFFPYGSYYVYVGSDAEKDLGYRSFKSATFDYQGRLSFNLPRSTGREWPRPMLPADRSKPASPREWRHSMRPAWHGDSSH